ncbi:hypothetical protein DSO57_1022448 [Entomophthora muscae]|uniref:Uncharacterized protein n=1 Tax=Entomophthora muscae TaxID=34485 RepID=A0ACC2TQK6_9FUNG|nr:hypothetical protein DSO57_1022448 [Entomophthora muscae]
MDKKNRNARGQQVEGRLDLFYWESLLSNFKKLNAFREDNAIIAKSIADVKLRFEKASPDSSFRLSSKLHKYLKDGDDSASRTKSVLSEIRNCLKTLRTMQTTGDFSSYPDFKRQRIDLEPSHSSSANSIRPISRPKQPHRDHIPNGSMVAAKMIESKDPNQEWILATVIHYYPDRNKYQVEDAEADETDGQKSKYVLSAMYVIQLPDEQDLSFDNEFPSGHEVLALYPNTTCFYKATVIFPPSKVSSCS